MVRGGRSSILRREDGWKVAGAFLVEASFVGKEVVPMSRNNNWRFIGTRFYVVLILLGNN